MPPYWFVFDLDETLTHLEAFYFILCSFFTKEFYINIGKSEKAAPVPESIKEQLQDAYHIFVKKCAESEKVEPYLGVLRPGILDVFARINQLKNLGLLGGCFIYSNNMLNKSIEFIRDVIHTAIGRSDLICDIVSRNDIRRLDDPKTRKKTLATIQKIIQEGSCNQSSAVDPDNIFFFDDINHPDLKEKLGDNYIQVTPYTYIVPFNRITKIYKESLQEAGLLDKGSQTYTLFKHIAPCFPGLSPTNSVNSLDTFIARSAKFTNVEPPVLDNSLNEILARLDTILSQNTLGNNPISAIQENVFAGGRRRRRSSQTKKASRKNRRNNRTKWRHQRA